MKAATGIRRRRLPILLAGGAAALGVLKPGTRALAQTDSPLLRFVRDISGNDAPLAARVASYEASPPATIDEIGFYGGEKFPASVRIWLATVSRLRDGKFIDSAEDKYSPEVFLEWRDRGLIDPTTFGPAAKAAFGNIFGQSPESVGDNPEDYAALGAAFRANFAGACAEIEKQIAERGKTLASVDDAGGDTMFFALLSPQQAERWMDRAFAMDGATQYGVRTPDWRRFWHHMTYALGFGLGSQEWDDTPPADLPGKRPLAMAE